MGSILNKTVEGSTFKIKYFGELNQIDANTLINSLINTTNIIHETNRHIENSKNIEIKIKAVEKGSFIIVIELVEKVSEISKTLFTKENIMIGSALISSVVGIIQIHKFLRGKKPKKVDAKKDVTTITNEKGDNFIIENLVLNIYETSPVIKDALTKNFETLDNDDDIDAMELMNENDESLIKIEKKDFQDLTLKYEELEADEKRMTVTARLYIVRLSFEEGLKWDFYFKGNKITASIEDEDFQKIIDNGESFAKGDILEVDLTIVQKYDFSVKTFVNKKYIINKVISHTPYEPPLELDIKK